MSGSLAAPAGGSTPIVPSSGTSGRGPRPLEGGDKAAASPDPAATAQPQDTTGEAPADDAVVTALAGADHDPVQQRFPDASLAVTTTSTLRPYQGGTVVADEQVGAQGTVGGEPDDQLKLGATLAREIGGAGSVEQMTLSYATDDLGSFSLAGLRDGTGTLTATLRPDTLQRVFDALSEGGDQGLYYGAGAVLFAGALLVAKPKAFDVPVASTLLEREGLAVRQTTTLQYQTAGDTPRLVVGAAQVEIAEDWGDAGSGRQSLAYDGAAGQAKFVLEFGHQSLKLAAGHTQDMDTGRAVQSWLAGSDKFALGEGLSLQVDARQEFDASGRGVNPSLSLAADMQAAPRWNLRLESQATATETGAPMSGYVAGTVDFQDPDAGSASTTTLRRDYAPGWQPIQSTLTTNYAWHDAEARQYRVDAQHVAPSDPLTPGSGTVSVDVSGLLAIDMPVHLLASTNYSGGQQVAKSYTFDLDLQKSRAGRLHLNVKGASQAPGEPVRGSIGVVWDMNV